MRDRSLGRPAGYSALRFGTSTGPIMMGSRRHTDSMGTVGDLGTPG
jgi:hypothetical protein